MCKCDWCENARRDKKTGQFYCPYSTCLLTQKDILKILEALKRV